MSERTAVVTGTSSGIGERTARRLARDGWRVLLVARREERLRVLSDELRDSAFLAVDLTDPDAVGRVLGEVRATSSRIDLLLHAAGLEISRAMPGKAPAEFDLVFGVKSDGWFNVLRSAGDLPIGATVVFSSVAGRFGNAGQTDYSAANDLLCKITSSARRTRPGTRALALDWTAWGGIGMATRGSIPKVMAQAVGTLTPQAISAKKSTTSITILMPI